MCFYTLPPPDVKKFRAGILHIDEIKARKLRNRPSGRGSSEVTRYYYIDERRPQAVRSRTYGTASAVQRLSHSCSGHVLGQHGMKKNMRFERTKFAAVTKEMAHRGMEFLFLLKPPRSQCWKLAGAVDLGHAYDCRPGALAMSAAHFGVLGDGLLMGAISRCAAARPKAGPRSPLPAISAAARKFDLE